MYIYAATLKHTSEIRPAVLRSCKSDAQITPFRQTRFGFCPQLLECGFVGLTFAKIGENSANGKKHIYGKN